jgi:hypothetical protein
MPSGDGEPAVRIHSGFCPEGLQKEMASHPISNFCGLFSKAPGFFHQPLVVGMTPLHGGCSTFGGGSNNGAERTIGSLTCSSGRSRIARARQSQNISFSFHTCSNYEHRAPGWGCDRAKIAEHFGSPMGRNKMAGTESPDSFRSMSLKNSMASRRLGPHTLLISARPSANTRCRAPVALSPSSKRKEQCRAADRSPT